MAQLPKTACYGRVMKNFMAFKETANERLFLMKDQAAVEVAVGLVARVCEGMSQF
jgi:hypothetical protein